MREALGVSRGSEEGVAQGLLSESKVKNVKDGIPCDSGWEREGLMPVASSLSRLVGPAVLRSVTEHLGTRRVVGLAVGLHFHDTCLLSRTLRITCRASSFNLRRRRHSRLNLRHTRVST